MDVDMATAALIERQIFDNVEKEMPDLWRACYPRVYQEPSKCGSYCSPKRPARQLATIALKIMSRQIGESELYEFQLASHLTKFRVPMYWLSESIAEAIRQTTPPGSIDWYDMHLPFEAAIFMLPKGCLTHRTDGDCAYICYARMRAGVEYRAPLLPGKTYGSVNGGLVIGASVDAGYFLHWNVPLQFYGPKTTMAQIHELMSRFSVHEHRTAVPLRNQGSMTPDDHALGAEVAHMLFSTLLLMTARPELVSEGQMTHKAPAKKGREAKEFWSPAIIGEHYRLRREHAEYQGGTHASPRFHWVKGFWREQPYGPGREKRYTKWIEPYTRGLDQKDAATTLAQR